MLWVEIYTEYMKREAKLRDRSPKINNKLFMLCREYASYHGVSNLVVAPAQLLRVHLNCVDTTEWICIDDFFFMVALLMYLQKLPHSVLNSYPWIIRQIIWPQCVPCTPTKYCCDVARIEAGSSLTLSTTIFLYS